jgi:hypothetical protein
VKIPNGRKRANMGAGEDIQRAERDHAVEEIMGRGIWLDDPEDGTSMHDRGPYKRRL